MTLQLPKAVKTVVVSFLGTSLFFLPSLNRDFSFSQSSALADDAACRSALAEARSRIWSVRDASIERVSATEHGYSNPPGNRRMSVDFVLSGRGGYNIMDSPAFSTDITTNIISSCPSVGMVIFAIDGSDVYEMYGLMRNGRVEAFKCTSDARYSETWGYDYRPEEAGWRC